MVCCCSNSMITIVVSFTNPQFNVLDKSTYPMFCVDYFKNLNNSQSVCYKTEFFPISFKPLCQTCGSDALVVFDLDGLKAMFLDFNKVYSLADLNIRDFAPIGGGGTISICGSIPSSYDYNIPLLSASGSLIPAPIKNDENALVDFLKSISFPVIVSIVNYHVPMYPITKERSSVQI